MDEKQLSIDCYRLLMNFVDGRPHPEAGGRSSLSAYVEPVIREIESHYDLDLTREALSRQVYITPQYLTGFFVVFELFHL